MQRTIIKAETVEEILRGKDVRFMRLWDVYNGLLTEHQREITNLYFNCDLSLGEIAEQKGVSRQSVSDCLRKCRKQLEETEEKLHHVRAMDEISQEYSRYMTQVLRWAEAQKKAHPEWTDELDELLRIQGSDGEIIEIEE